MKFLIILGVISQIFLLRMFYLGLKEKHKNRESITFEIILLTATYVPFVILLGSFLIK